MEQNLFDTTGTSFEQDVIAASGRVPVLVDFWAPWCGPCRALTPVLEKLVREFGGTFRLAKLNIDEHPEIPARFAVRGIPNVKAFVDGKVVDEFTGALPEGAVRAFLARVVPSPGEQQRRTAQALIAQGEFEEAEAKLREALVVEPGLDAARLDLAELLTARRDLTGAEAVIEPLVAFDRDPRFERIVAQISTWKKSRELPDLPELAARLEREPANPALRSALAERLIIERQFAAALEELLRVVHATRGEARDEARKAMLRVFALASDDPDLVGKYRRLLAGALN